MSTWGELVTVKRLGRIERLRWRITTAIYRARCTAGQQGLPVESVLRSWSA